MKSLQLWIVGGLLAVVAAAQTGDALMQRGVLPGSSFFALSEVASSSSSEVFDDPAPTHADIAVTLQAAEKIQRPDGSVMDLNVTLAIANNGPAAAQGVNVLLPVPQGTTFVSANSPSCTLQGANVSCAFGIFPNGQTSFVTLKYRLPAVLGICAATQYQFRAFGWATQMDIENANNQATATTHVTCPQTTSASSAASQSSFEPCNFAGCSSSSFFAQSSQASFEPCNFVGCSSSSPTIPPFSSSSSRSSSVSSYNDWPWPSSSSRPSAASSASSAMTDIVVRSETAPTVNKGGTVFYDLVVSNVGRDAAPNVAVSIFGNYGLYLFFLPEQSDLRCTPSSTTMVTCALGNVNPSEEIRVRIAATLQFQCNTTYNVQVLTNSIASDTNPANNRFILGTAVQCPSFASTASVASVSSASSVRSWSSVAASAGADVTARPLNNPVVLRGNSYTHTIELSNNGPDTAQNPSIDYPLPPDFQIDTTQLDSRCAMNGRTVQCSVQSLAARTSTSFRLVVKTGAQMECVNKSIGINARMAGVDPVSTNNQTMAVVQVTCGNTGQGDKVDVQVITTHMNSKVAQAATIRHAFRVDNNGPSVARDVTLTEQIPNGFTYVDAESDQRCDQSGTNVVCRIPSIAAFEPTDVTVILRAGNEQPCGITQGTVTVAGGGQETNSFNNTITVQTKVLCQSSAQLSVSVQSGEADVSSFRGQKNALLMRFFVVGDSSRDTTFNSVRFKADKGDVMNAQSYSLFVDMDYNGTAETGLKRGVVPANGVVDFRDLPGGGQILSAGRTMTMELRADIAVTPVSNVLRIAFDTASPAYIVGEASDGSLSRVATNGACAFNFCQINVAASSPRTINIASAGNLYVTRDTDVIRSRQLQGGTLGDSVLRLAFRSPDEETEVTQLQISTWDTAGVSVESLELYKSDEMAPFAIATVAGCESEAVLTTNPANNKVIRTYCASMQNKELLIPTYWDVDVIVRPRMRSDEDGGVSGEPLTFWLPARAGVVKARGSLSQTSIANNDGDMTAEGEVFIGVSSALPGRDVMGNPNQSVLSKIMSVTNSAANPGYVINYEAQEVARYRFTMAPNGNTRNGLNRPVITDLLFSVIAQGLTLDTATFQATSSLDYNDRFACSALPGSVAGETLVECRGLPFEALPSVDISLLVDIPSVGPSSWVQTTLKNISDAAATSFGTAPGQGRIRWKDTDAFAKDIFWLDLQSPNIPSTQFRGLSQ